MAKALITNRIYLDNPGPEITKNIVASLTYKIQKDTGSKKFNSLETIRMYKKLTNGIISIPQMRSDLIPDGYEIIDKRVCVPAKFPEPAFKLYDNQVPVFEAASDSCIINALVGFGKSIVALHVAANLGQKTLIVTHTVALRDQWKDEIQALFGIECGVIGSGILDYKDHDIVVSNIQTLKKYATLLSKEFGTVVVDECLDYDTTVRTKEFGVIRIGQLVNQKLDCSVLSYNIETDQPEYKKVLKHYKNPHNDCLEIKYGAGRVLKCTDNHSVFTLKNDILTKVSAKELGVGDILLETKTSTTYDNVCLRSITSIGTSTLKGGNKYNIEVEDNHNYFANNILVSNCHRTPSSTFTDVLDKLYARYRIGLSGTLKRKDKKDVLLPNFFGYNIIKAEGNTMTPTVFTLNTGITLKPDAIWVDKISDLIANVDYQKLIAKVALVQIAKGHKVLVIADRVEFLETIGKMIGSRCMVITGTIGDRNEAKAKMLSGEIDCIAGSRQIFSEGISINNLSCAILGGPINNDSLLEQIIGRIQRTHLDKLNPIVIDPQFAGWADKKQNRARLGLYLRKGWVVEAL